MAKPMLTDVQDRARTVLEVLRRVFDYTDADLARGLGVTRAAIQNKRAGRRRFTADELEVLAGAFDVPVSLFFGDPESALHWILDNRPGEIEQAVTTLAWFTAVESLLESPLSELSSSAETDPLGVGQFSTAA